MLHIRDKKSSSLSEFQESEFYCLNYCIGNCLLKKSISSICPWHDALARVGNSVLCRAQALKRKVSKNERNTRAFSQSVRRPAADYLKWIEKMRGKIIVRALICTAALGVSAGALGEPLFSPAACYKKCTSFAFEDPDALVGRYAERMKKIQDLQKQQQVEQSHEKQKILREAEEAETERLKDALDKSCSKMCQMDR